MISIPTVFNTTSQCLTCAMQQQLSGAYYNLFNALAVASLFVGFGILLIGMHFLIKTFQNKINLYKEVTDGNTKPDNTGHDQQSHL